MPEFEKQILQGERELLLQLAEGSEDAFRLIFQHYGPLIHKNIYGIIKVDMVSKDLVQDTFLRVWLYRDKLPEIDDFRNWLLRISYNRSFSYLRDLKTHTKSMEPYAANYALQEQDLNAAMEIQLLSLRETIQQTIQALPPQQKRIYTLSRENGLKIPEIAAELDLSPNTIKNTLVKALQTIRVAIERAGYGGVLVLVWETVEYFFMGISPKL